MAISRRALFKRAVGAVGATSFGGFAEFEHDLTEQLSLSLSGDDALGEASIRQEIRQENALPGAIDWLRPEIDAEIRRQLSEQAKQEIRDPRLDSATGEAPPVAGVPIEVGREIDGYADAMSVNTGESLALRVSSSIGAYRVAVLRLGWYDGAGAREISRSAIIPGTKYAGSAYQSPGWDANGMVSCGWPVGHNLSTAGWSSGYYLAALISVNTGQTETYIPFVVRDDSSSAGIVMQIPFTTYQAYNYWGGKSTYTGDDAKPAQVVSFDRPYRDLGGTGHLFYGDFQVLSWLERHGYPVTYVASSDVHRRPDLMNGRKLLLSVYHDEYWSQSMRNNLVSWIASGKSLAMFSANNIYWRIRFDNNTLGIPDRVMSCYKGYPEPSAERTILFRDLGQNEAEIEGVEFAGAAYETSDWVVTNANHWIYAGTGLQNGDRLAGVIGGEWDSRPAFAPPDTTTIASIPKQSIDFGPTVQSSVIRDVASGATVFSASTLFFGQFFGGAYSRREDPSVIKMATNLLSHVGVNPGSQPPQPPQPPLPPQPPVTQPPPVARVVAGTVAATPTAPRQAAPGAAPVASSR
jgi:hypothetical protein